MSKAEYKRLGDYIRPVDVRNRELKVTNLLGLSMSKQFRPSTSNIVDVDLTKYKVVDRNVFAFDPMSVIRVHKVPIAINDTNDPIIVSPAYYTFEIIDSFQLLPQYLMMWFQRTEFDRYADFKSDAAVRGGYDWDELCNTPIYIPSITRQREIVSEYETLTNRIRLNEQMIAKLEETAQALYRKMFVDGIDKENLPEGWRWGTLSDIATITMGQSPDGETYNLDGQGIIFYQGRTDFGRRFPTARVYTTNPTRFAKEGDVLLSVRAPVGDLNVASHNCCIGRGLASLRSKDGCRSYLFYQLQALSDVFNVSDDEGTIFGSINKDDLFNIGIVIPALQKMKMFEERATIIDKQIELKDKEINNLVELQSLLFAKIGKE